MPVKNVNYYLKLAEEYAESARRGEHASLANAYATMAAAAAQRDA